MFQTLETFTVKILSLLLTYICMIIIIFHWRFWHAALTSNIWDLAVSQHLIRELCHKEVNERQTFSKDVCCLVACCIKMVLWGPARKAQMLVHLSMQKSDIFVNIQNKKKGGKRDYLIHFLSDRVTLYVMTILYSVKTHQLDVFTHH